MHGTGRHPLQRTFGKATWDRLYALGTMLALWLVLGCSGGRTDADSQQSDREDTVQSSSKGGFGVLLTGSDAADARGWCDGSKLEKGRVPVDAAALAKVSLYQGVEIPLGQDAAVDVVVGRAGLVRVFLSGTIGVDGAILELRDAKQHYVFEDVRRLHAPTQAGELEQSYNFMIPEGLIQLDTSLSVRLFRVQTCADASNPREEARFPRSGSLELKAREVGSLQIVVIPVIYGTDGSNRVPNVSPERLAALRDSAYARFPVSEVSLSLHEEFRTMQERLTDVLSEVMHMRTLEKPASQVIYFGLVNPADTMDIYCPGSCVAGISAIGSASGRGTSGVGVGFDDSVVETFLHELGHVMRLTHAPCGSPVSPDPDYPHPEARLGSWGFDLSTNQLVDPSGDARDLMSYCDPTWISDYNYQNLIERVSYGNAELWADVQGGEDLDAREAGPRLHLHPRGSAAMAEISQSERVPERVSCVRSR